MLSYCQPSSISGHPTWVLDWTGDIDRLLILKTGIMGCTVPVSSAGGGTKPYVQFEDDKTTDPDPPDDKHPNRFIHITLSL